MASLDSTNDEILEVRSNNDILQINIHGYSDRGNVPHNNLENLLLTRLETGDTQHLQQSMENSANSQRHLASGFESDFCDVGINQSSPNTCNSSPRRRQMNQSSFLTEARDRSNFDNEYNELSPASNLVYYDAFYRNGEDDMYTSSHHPYSLNGEDQIVMNNLYPTCFTAEDESSMNSRVYSHNLHADISLEKSSFLLDQNDPSPPNTSCDGMTRLSHEMNDITRNNYGNRYLMNEDLAYYNGYNNSVDTVSASNYSFPIQSESSNPYAGESSFEVSSEFQGTHSLGMSTHYSNVIRESFEGYNAHGSFTPSPSFGIETLHELYRLILQTKADDNENRTLGSWELVRHYILTSDFDLVNTAARITSPGGLTPLHQACRHDPPDDIIELILTYAGPDILQLQDKNGLIPLHHACIHMTSELVINMLVQGYPDGLLVQDSKGFTPLHYSVTNLASSLRIVEKLCVQGAVDALDRDGMSPLHYTTIINTYFQPSIIGILVLAHPQGVACPDRQGRIPARYLARSCHELEVVQILEQAIATDPSLCKGDMALILLKGLVDCVKKVGKSINIQRFFDIILEHNPEPSHAFTLTLKTLPSWLLVRTMERPQKSKKNSILKVISKGILLLKKSKKKSLEKDEKK
jgi:Ankyrin repeats (3 copies)